MSLLEGLEQRDRLAVAMAQNQRVSEENGDLHIPRILPKGDTIIGDAFIHAAELQLRCGKIGARWNQAGRNLQDAFIVGYGRREVTPALRGQGFIEQLFRSRILGETEPCSQAEQSSAHASILSVTHGHKPVMVFRIKGTASRSPPPC